MTRLTSQKQLASFIAKYTPAMGRYARQVLAKMRARLPGAIEMVYDNYNGLVIGFGPTERPSEAVFSIVLFPEHISMCFLQGASLPDPKHLLKGSGNVVRHIRLKDAHDIDHPDVEQLIARALKQSPKKFDPTKPGRMLIRSISAKQRPRRPK